MTDDPLPDLDLPVWGEVVGPLPDLDLPVWGANGGTVET